MDWRQVAAEMLRGARGKRSQAGFSRRLGYRSNVACDWEAGRRLPTAGEFLRVCQLMRIDVAAAFARFQPACAPSIGGPLEFTPALWLEALAGNTGAAELARRGGFHRLQVQRWLRGQTRPRLHQFLALVDTISGRASDLVDSLMPIAQVPALRTVHARRMAAKNVAFDEPWSAAVLRVLETRGYRRRARHLRGYLAARLGFDTAWEERLLARLVEVGLLRERDGRYEADEPLTVDAQADSERVRALRTHWTDVCRERVQAPQPEDWLAFNVVSTSVEDMDAIRAILRGAFREIRALAATSEPVDSVALINMQLVTWNREPGDLE